MNLNPRKSSASIPPASYNIIRGLCEHNQEKHTGESFSECFPTVRLAGRPVSSEKVKSQVLCL